MQVTSTDWCCQSWCVLLCTANPLGTGGRSSFLDAAYVTTLKDDMIIPRMQLRLFETIGQGMSLMILFLGHYGMHIPFLMVSQVNLELSTEAS